MPRLVVAHDSFYADELSTYWIVSTKSLAGVIETVRSDAEITPPLSFVAAWLTTRIGLAPELFRALSLVAGVAAIPLVYLIGRRTVGARAGLVAAALTALSPFMIYYSAEARGYALMITLVLLSTLALLVACEEPRARWWVAYAVFSCLAVYTHYTAVFALGAQLMWVLWAHPEARRAAVLANLGAAIAFAPWLPGLFADFNSPTTEILGDLRPFTLASAADSLAHWSIGYPYGNVALRSLPGAIALTLAGAGLAAGIAGAVEHGRRPAPPSRRPSSGLLLIITLALAAPVATALASLVSTDLFGTRNLAASWPGAALGIAALLTASRGFVRAAAVALVLSAFAIGTAKMFDQSYQRPDYQGAADLAGRAAASSTPVIDATGLTPGPLTGLDVMLDEPLRLFRAGTPAERSHPFTIFDPVVPVTEATRDAAASSDGRLVVVAFGSDVTASGGGRYGKLGSEVVQHVPENFRQVESTTLDGIIPISVLVFERSGGLRAREPGDGTS